LTIIRWAYATGASIGSVSPKRRCKGQQAVLYEIFGQLPVAGEDVGETR